MLRNNLLFEYERERERGARGTQPCKYGNASNMIHLFPNAEPYPTWPPRACLESTDLTREARVLLPVPPSLLYRAGGGFHLHFFFVFIPVMAFALVGNGVVLGFQHGSCCIDVDYSDMT